MGCAFFWSRDFWRFIILLVLSAVAVLCTSRFLSLLALMPPEKREVLPRLISVYACRDAGGEHCCISLPDFKRSIKGVHRKRLSALQSCSRFPVSIFVPKTPYASPFHRCASPDPSPTLPYPSPSIFVFSHPGSSCTFKTSSVGTAEEAWAAADASLASNSRQRSGPTLVLSQGLVQGQVCFSIIC